MKVLALDAVYRTYCLCIEDSVLLEGVDSVVQRLELLLVDRLHLATVDIIVVAYYIVVLLAAALTVAVTHIEHYYLRSNYRMVERSKREIGFGQK